MSDAFSSHTFDVIVIGAGIVGCACARECAIAGLRVALVERSTAGSGATAAAMGHIVAMDDSPAQLALTRYGRELWTALAPRLSRAVEYEPCGTLWVAADAEEMDEVRAKHATCQAAGVASSVLSAAELTREEPNLRPNLAGGLLVPGDAVIYPPAAAAFLLHEAKEHGAVHLHEAAVACGGTDRVADPGHAAGRHTPPDNAPGTVLLADGTMLSAMRVVLATGSDTSLLPGLPVHRRKGHLLITDRYPGFVRHQLVELGYLKSAHRSTADSVAFNIQPRQTGQLLIGSSRQYGNADPATDAALVEAMLARALAYMPGLAQLSGLRLWTGFRAATPDKLPLIGPTPDPGLWLAMGFEGLGITTSLAAARLLVDQLLERPCAIEVSPYAPARLQVQPGQVREPAHA